MDETDNVHEYNKSHFLKVQQSIFIEGKETEVDVVDVVAVQTRGWSRAEDFAGSAFSFRS